MIKFNNIDPNTVQDDDRVILSFTAYMERLKKEKYYFLLKDAGYLIWAVKSYFPPMNGEPAEWSGGTRIEFPQEGLSWFINTIEQKFFKSESEGGLKKGEFSCEKEFLGENLVVARMLGTSGYAFRNYSRQDYAYTTKTSPQQASFDDEMLFKNGLFDELKKIAKQIDMDNL